MRINRTIGFLLGYLMFFISFPSVGQISPGELAKVHTHLEGLTNCTKCHILGEKVSNQKCLECHTELKARIDIQKGYHASVEVRGKECVKCHSDHHGLNFQIVRFEKEKFNHDLTGFKLLGAHGKKKCVDCHKNEFIADPKIKKKKFTYLGLTNNCVPCHADYHQKTLSQECFTCHDNEKFKPATKFDHSKAKFKLQGKHLTVLCISCHKSSLKNGQKFQEFKGLKFDNCTACHTDKHQGKFGQNCKECHSEQSFTLINGTQDFDHDKTDFKLDGKHKLVACKTCHKSKITNAMQFDKCTRCHTDYHYGQFAKQGVSPDCSQCHTVKGFVGSTYTIEQHNGSVFPLKGAHVATPCFACHKKSEKWSFREIGKRCIDCHKDIHKPNISEKYYPESVCENCHSENRWNLVNFDHGKTKFALVGAHVKKGCCDCHFKKEPDGKIRQEFAGMSVQCSNCHNDIHNKQFENNGATDCAQCHTNDAFKPAPKFNHNTSRFPLDGKHQKVACVKCHKPVQNQGLTYVLYKINKIKCEDCHQ